MSVFKESDRLIPPGGHEMIDSQTKLIELCEYITKNAAWYTAPKSLCAFLGIPWIGPMLYEQSVENPKIMGGGGRFEKTISSLDPKNREVKECIKSGSGYFLVAPITRMDEVVPILPCGIYSLLQQGGDDGAVMRRTNERVVKDFDNAPVKEVKPSKKAALPVNEKADRLSRDFGLDEGNVQILIMDGYVMAFFSPMYVPLPPEKLVCGQLLPWLKREFPDYSFNSGEYSHEYLWATFALGDSEAAGTVEGILSSAGYGSGKVELTLRFSTSDIGFGAVRVTIMANMNGVEIPLGCSVWISHKGDVSPETFREALDRLLLLVKDIDEAIERLALKKVANPAVTLKKILKRDRKGHLSGLSPFVNEEAVSLSKKIADNPRSGCGLDVYMSLNTAVMKWRQNKNPSPRRYLEVSDYIAELLLYEKFEFDED